MAPPVSAASLGPQASPPQKLTPIVRVPKIAQIQQLASDAIWAGDAGIPVPPTPMAAAAAQEDGSQAEAPSTEMLKATIHKEGGGTGFLFFLRKTVGNRINQPAFHSLNVANMRRVMADDEDYLCELAQLVITAKLLNPDGTLPGSSSGDNSPASSRSRSGSGTPEAPPSPEHPSAPSSDPDDSPPASHREISAAAPYHRQGEEMRQKAADMIGQKTSETNGCEYARDVQRQAFNKRMQWRKIASAIVLVAAAVLGVFLHPAAFALGYLAYEYGMVSHNARVPENFVSPVLQSKTLLFRLLVWMRPSVRNHFTFHFQKPSEMEEANWDRLGSLLKQPGLQSRNPPSGDFAPPPSFFIDRNSEDARLALHEQLEPLIQEANANRQEVHFTCEPTNPEQSVFKVKVYMGHTHPRLLTPPADEKPLSEEEPRVVIDLTPPSEDALVAIAAQPNTEQLAAPGHVFDPYDPQEGQIATIPADRPDLRALAQNPVR